MDHLRSITPQVQSTAGAVPVINEKGEISMQKVKVKRYVTGKIPEYALKDSSDDNSDEDIFVKNKEEEQTYQINEDLSDRRLRRIQRHKEEDENLQTGNRGHRHVVEPEVLEAVDIVVEEKEVDDINKDIDEIEKEVKAVNPDVEMDDEEFQLRRQQLRLKAQQNDQEEILEIGEENPISEDSEESDYDSYADSESDTEVKLKPVFVSKKDRTTLQEIYMKEQKEIELQKEKQKLVEIRRKDTLKIIEEAIKEDLNTTTDLLTKLEVVDTDDEDHEAEYEAWKLRELKRIKRNKEEKEKREKEAWEIERLRNLTEEEREKEMKNKPKVVTNKAERGKYQFLQKYYHRGAFYLDREEDILKRNVDAPTLEDRIDKTKLPAVLQVKNFGRSGRSKYTHLADQDTSTKDSPWNDKQRYLPRKNDLLERPTKRRRL